MKVTDYIKEEHKQVEALFEEFDKKKHLTIVQKISDILLPHHHAEEHTVFPGVAKESPQKQEVVDYLKAEHDIIHLQLKDILSGKRSDSLFEAKVEVLKELVEHHLKEEEDVFFKHAEEVYTEAALEKTTPKFKQAEEDYQEQPTND